MLPVVIVLMIMVIVAGNNASLPLPPPPHIEPVIKVIVIEKEKFCVYQPVEEEESDLLPDRFLIEENQIP